jgi:hypothetical protein
MRCNGPEGVLRTNIVNAFHALPGIHILGGYLFLKTIDLKEFLCYDRLRTVTLDHGILCQLGKVKQYDKGKKNFKKLRF